MVYVCDSKFPERFEGEAKCIFDKWPFDLSDFQKYSIYAILKKKHAIVTAHTGSGKTLPAVFALSHFVGSTKKKKVIYTAPIKALSNQKFHEFSERFPEYSFGILTGDIKFNPEADVLIMTTEILRNTLFQMKMIEEGTFEESQLDLHFKMNMETELGCVIFDEIHYINDADRGKVWEETIMMLPDSVQILGLSATIDSPKKFCQWIETVKKREVWLCPHDKRVVPLKHYAYLTLPTSTLESLPKNIKTLISNNNFYEQPIIIKEQGSVFKDYKYNKLLKILDYFELNSIRVKQGFVLNQIVRHMKDNDLLPAICFVFSRKKTLEYAKKISLSLFEKDSKVPSIIKAECDRILRKLPNYKEYIKLPEYVEMVKLLEKGIAIHHSGVPMVFREMVELLFSKKYIKLLFATETFAVGINMPTRSVIFTSITKFDGKKFRYLQQHEYTQMAGRGGRRGIDTVGHVFHLLNLYNGREGLPKPNTMRTMFGGKPPVLESKFKIHFNLILRLLSVGNKNFGDFAEKSMLKNTIDKEKSYYMDRVESLHDDLQRVNETLLNIPTPQNILEEYYENKLRLVKLNSKKRKKLKIKMKNVSEEYKNIESHCDLIDKKKNIQENYEDNNNRIKNTESYIKDEVNTVVKILNDEGFVETKEDELILTERGQVASNIQEIHCLAMGELLDDKIFNKLTAIELISVFSCFTSIKLSDNNTIFNIKHINTNDTIKSTIQTIKNKLNKYYDIETFHKTSFVENYDIQYNLCEYMIRWCEASTEGQCKVIYGDMKHYDIFLGGFVKAILKINNIANELQNVCLLQNNLQLLEQLKKIPELTLKSVVTNQSLYL